MDLLGFMVYRWIDVWSPSPGLGVNGDMGACAGHLDISVLVHSEYSLMFVWLSYFLFILVFWNYAFSPSQRSSFFSNGPGSHPEQVDIPQHVRILVLYYP